MNPSGRAATLERGPCNRFCRAALTCTPQRVVPGVGRRPWLSPIADRPAIWRRSARRTDVLCRQLRATGGGAKSIRSSVRRLPPAGSRATGQFLCRAVALLHQPASVERGKRLWPRHGLLRAHLRRPLFPAAAPCRRHAGRALQVFLSGRQDHGVLRRQDRHRRRAKRHALRRSRQRLRLSRQDGRWLHLQRQGRAGARPCRHAERSDLAAR